MNRQYQPEEADAVMLGVCARIAAGLDVDPLLVRVNAVLAGLMFAPIIVPAYLVTGLLLRRRIVDC